MSGEGSDSSYRNSTRVEGCVRSMKELLCHVGPRTSLHAPFNTSSFFVTLSTSSLWEASFSNYAPPFKLSFISWEGWLLLPGAVAACCPPALLVSPAKVTGVIFHHGTGPVHALNVSTGVVTAGGKGHHGFYYPKPSSFQQQSENHPGTLICMEVIISAGFSPRVFFLLFSPYFSFLFFLFVGGFLVGRLVGFYFGVGFFFDCFSLRWVFFGLGHFCCCWVWFRVFLGLVGLVLRDRS